MNLRAFEVDIEEHLPNSGQVTKTLTFLISVLNLSASSNFVAFFYELSDTSYLFPWNFTIWQPNQQMWHSNEVFFQPRVLGGQNCVRKQRIPFTTNCSPTSNISPQLFYRIVPSYFAVSNLPHLS